ncbi:MAG: PspA-associated protein PspAB [Pseudonocardiaceae bacterium]
MKFLDALLGRTKPKQPDLNALFAVTGAAITLQAAVGLRPSGQAAVAFKPASGQAFAATSNELLELARYSGSTSGTELRTTDDEYGYRWIVLADPDLEDLVATVHLVNAGLTDQGFGSQLLCSVFGFAAEDGGAACHLVYLYKRGTFYPFAPQTGQRRDNELELRLRGAVAAELPLEPDLARWFPLWGLPLDGGTGK